MNKVKELYKQEPNLRGLVLDLRNDPGGLLDSAVAISAAFLPESALISHRARAPAGTPDSGARQRTFSGVY